MPKLKSPQYAPSKFTPPVSKPDLWSGPWGKINPTPQSVQTLRLCKDVSSTSEETFSYPYRNLSCWRWHRILEDEELKIQAGPDAITIRGVGLIRLVDALDAGALETVRIDSTIASVARERPIHVKSLVIEMSERH